MHVLIFYLRLLKVMIQRNSSCVHLPDGRGKTPLHYAAENGHYNVAQIIVCDAKPDVNAV